MATDTPHPWLRTKDADVNINRGISDDDDVVLARAGKRSQLKREWGFWAILGFAFTNLCTWEAAGTLIGPAFVNGGPVSVVFGFMAASFGMLFVYASIAEMASIYPVAGGEYHWAAAFASPKWRPFMSYIQGWTTTFAWQCVTAAAFFLFASLIQALVVLGQPEYTPKPYQCTLIMILAAGITFTFVTVGKGSIRLIETISGVCHVLFFFAIMITLLVLGKKAPSAFVWKDFENNGGWSSNGVSFCLGFLGPAFALLGADGCVHMAEETHHANKTIPRAMVLSLITNAILGLAFIITLLYSVSDLTAALTTPTGFPVIEIYRQATGSTGGAIAIQSLILIIWLGGCICCMAGSSRLIWAFARDRGLPFSSFLSHVDSTLKVPLRALCVTFTIVIILSLVVIGSEVALNAILSLSTVSLLFSYLLLLCNFLFYRIRHVHSIAYGPWHLGVLGVPINAAAIAFCVFLIVFLPFPTTVPVKGPTMNYTGPVLGFVLLFAVGNWVIHARHHFTGPIIEIEQEDVARMGNIDDATMESKL